MKFDIKDGLMLAGILLTAYGLWSIYPPAMFIIVGIFIIFLAWPRKGGG